MKISLDQKSLIGNSGHLHSRYISLIKKIHSVLSVPNVLGAVLCTDAARNYAYFAKKKKLKHVSVNGSKKQYVAEKVYHIQHVNSYHSRLEDTINHICKGVATKNLDKYLAWKNFLEKHTDKNAFNSCV